MNTSYENNNMNYSASLTTYMKPQDTYVPCNWLLQKVCLQKGSWSRFIFNKTEIKVTGIYFNIQLRSSDYDWYKHNTNVIFIKVLSLYRIKCIKSI